MDLVGIPISIHLSSASNLSISGSQRLSISGRECILALINTEPTGDKERNRMGQVSLAPRCVDVVFPNQMHLCLPGHEQVAIYAHGTSSMRW